MTRRLKLKGFAFLKRHAPLTLKALSQEGGRNSQKLGKGHRWTPAEARALASEGGKARSRKLKRQK